MNQFLVPGFGVYDESGTRQFFIPGFGLILDIYTAGGDITLVVQEAGHGHTADNIVITQAHILAVAEALHGHAVDNIVLTQAQLLAVQRALHGHLADNVGLTQAHVLAVQDAWHAHHADNIVWVLEGDRVYPIRLPKRYADRYPPRN